MEIDLDAFDPALAARLRSEAHGMARTYVNAVLGEFGRESVSGIYAKGSAYMSWDSIVDYVPEVSDVDVHVRLAPGVDTAPVTDLVRALDVAARALASYEALFPEASHRPRPQLQFLHDLEELSGYVPSPAGAVHTLFGEEAVGPPREAYPQTWAADRARLLVDAAFVVDEIASKVIDRPGEAAWDVVRRLTFRVGPAGPRLLTHLGVHPFDAWSMNRTNVVRAFRECGRDDIAAAYADFYLAGWEGYHSAFADTGAARRALLSAHGLFGEARRLLGST